MRSDNGALSSWSRSSSATPFMTTYNLTGDHHTPQEAPMGMGSEGLAWSHVPWFQHPHWQAMNPLSSWMMTVIGVLMSIVGLLGTVGNVIVLFLLLRCKKLQTAANMYVFNMAAADLLMCLGNFPLLIFSSFAGKWVAGYVGCKIYSFVGGLSGFVSINTLTAMACDRYKAIYRHKGLVRSGSRRYSLGFLLSLWIYSFFWALPPFLGWGQFALDGGQISCCFDYLTRSTSNLSYIIAIFCFCFGIQVTVIIFCYGNIVRVVCQHEHTLRRGNVKILLYHNHFHRHHTDHVASNVSGSTVPRERPVSEPDDAHVLQQSMLLDRKAVRGARKRRMEMKVTRLVILITVSFFAAWMPFAVVALLGAFGNASLVTPMASTLPGLLAKASTVVNPLLYALGHPRYRNLLSKYFHQPRCYGWGRTRRRGADKVTLPTTRGILSSVYFATIMRQTDQGNVLSVEATLQVPTTIGSSSH